MIHPLISIIVPVYKAEVYLHRCVDSILAQTHTDWELLLVDDGSPDRSGHICDEYAARDARIRVFHKKNGGVASAREMGIQNARGEYSIHVDPDDWIDAETLQTLYSKAVKTKADVVLCDFMLEYNGRQETDRQEPCSLKPTDCLRQLMAQELHGSLCNKLVRTGLYRKYDLHFPEVMTCWEDLYICCAIMMHDVCVAYVSKAFYHYDFFTNDNSMVRKTDICGLNAQRHCIQLLEDMLPENRHAELNEMKGLVLVTAFRLQLLSEKEIRDIYPEVNDWYVGKYGNSWRGTYYYGLCCTLRGNSFKIAGWKMLATNLYMRIKHKLGL